MGRRRADGHIHNFVYTPPVFTSPFSTPFFLLSPSGPPFCFPPPRKSPGCARCIIARCDCVTFDPRCDFLSRAGYKWKTLIYMHTYPLSLTLLSCEIFCGWCFVIKYCLAPHIQCGSKTAEPKLNDFCDLFLICFFTLWYIFLCIRVIFHIFILLWTFLIYFY